MAGKLQKDKRVQEQDADDSVGKDQGKVGVGRREERRGRCVLEQVSMRRHATWNGS